MATGSSLLKGNEHNYVLAGLLAVFIISGAGVPDELADVVNTAIGKIIVFVMALNMFFLHPLVGVLGLVAAYELVKRSERATPPPVHVHVPSERKKANTLTRLNQFPPTVEEAVIASQIPYSFNLKQPSKAPYRPVQDPVFDAARISH